MGATAVVIPVFNGVRGLKECLPALSWTQDAGVDVVIADSGSTDGSLELIAGFRWARVVHVPTECWWAAATNAACMEAFSSPSTSYACLLNHDCILTRDSFDVLLKCSTEHSGDLVSARVVDARTGALVYDGGVRTPSGRLSVGRDSRPGGTKPVHQQVEWCGGMGVMVPRELFTLLRGFDAERFPHYYADADFAFRARRAGRQVWVCRDAVVLNDRTSTGISVPREGATLSAVVSTLTSRKSVFNVRDSLRFYARHGGLRAASAVVSLYANHLGSSARRLVRRPKA